jgi:hypothetical protein
MNTHGSSPVLTPAQQSSVERTWMGWTKSLPGTTAAPLTFVRVIYAGVKELAGRVFNLEEWRSAFESRLGRIESAKGDAALLERVEKLEAKMATGFQISAWAWKYEPGKPYRPGELTQRNGIWACLRETTTPPGSDPASWKLIVHRSKVGNDDDQ